MLPSSNASTDSAMMPTIPNMPTMNWVVRLAYIQLLSVGVESGAVAGSFPGEEVIESFVMSGSHLLRGTIQFHLALMDEADPVADLENCRHVVTHHDHGQP